MSALSLAKLSPFSISLLTSSPINSVPIPTLSELQKQAKDFGGSFTSLGSLPAYSVQPKIEPSPPGYEPRDPADGKIRKSRKGWKRVEIQGGIPGERGVKDKSVRLGQFWSG
ncbi:hypothetical protein TREMEDRAFT_60349 [Tremella mesenterica DSM 1558]|uniref:uncharacterized protein n=1 Tax=Tremella mesenterica (strain ATCC 24925 / CBS 8224 / DSM 1558 / NBRC 9311 / NRRL Y-6157 / RJB 2259-6 / UBC 559-6) TaxID=578456 RepID=UPI0003F4927C|nr:uncharacterized protein TREMEDRAFT_60349 [Tremella mesenterica DSM 1558]EIW71419.1 hypothetical protein TREMEDRAFT_60349 [Tremella mesenterica DSM 1558]